MLKCAQLHLLAFCSSESVFVFSSFHPLLFWLLFFSSTCEMPIWLGARSNKGVHTTRWAAKTNKTDHVDCFMLKLKDGYFNVKQELLLLVTPNYIIIIIVLRYQHRYSWKSCHISLLSIAFGRATSRIATELLYVGARCPAFAHLCAGVHGSTSLTSLSLLLQQCPACLVCLILIVFVMGSKWL